MTTKGKATQPRTVTLTAAEFHANPKQAFVEAGRVDRVVVTDSRGEARMVISRQRASDGRKR